MNKLTAEECRERIKYIRQMISDDTSKLSRGGQCQLQALEIALPILEQQESTTDTYRQIENDGWVEWGGGSGKPTDVVVDVRYRDGITDVGWAYIFNWEHRKAADDIIAYRAIENDGREG